MMSRVLFVSLAAAAASFLVNMGIATSGRALTGVPRAFPPFSPLPVLSGSVGEWVMAVVTFAVLRLAVARPDRAFLFVAVVALALSFSLPLRLTFTRSARFAGVTPAAQMVLVLMHAVVAVSVAVGVLWAAGRPPAA